jgi:hypothetical protein
LQGQLKTEEDKVLRGDTILKEGNIRGGGKIRKALL